MLQDEEGAIRLYGGKNLQRSAPIGGVYRMQEATATGSVFVNSGEYLGRYVEKARAADWEVQSRTCEGKLQAESAAARALREKLSTEGLQPWRQAYHRAHGVQRALVLATMVEFVTKGSL